MKGVTWKIYVFIFYINRLYYSLVHFCQLQLGYTRLEGYSALPLEGLLCLHGGFCLWASYNLATLFPKSVLLYKSTLSMYFLDCCPLPGDAILCTVKKKSLVIQSNWDSFPQPWQSRGFQGRCCVFCLLSGRLAVCPLLKEGQELGLTRLCVFAL